MGRFYLARSPAPEAQMPREVQVPSLQERMHVRTWGATHVSRTGLARQVVQSHIIRSGPFLFPGMLCHMPFEIFVVWHVFEFPDLQLGSSEVELISLQTRFYIKTDRHLSCRHLN
jgi:hypothetical protein